MIKFLSEKVHNAYLIETCNYEHIKKTIIDFAITLGFDRHLIESGTHPDIVFIESENKIIPIETIRNTIINAVNYTPKLADRKLYIIYDAKNISETCENAMLKTLEEPPEFVSIFLVTKNINCLLDTIKSRCQILKDTDDIDYKDLLNIEYLDDALRTLSNITYETTGDKMRFIETMFNKDTNLSNLIRIYRLAIRDALIYKTTLSKNRIKLREKEEIIMSIANSFSIEELGKLVDKLDTLSIMNNYNVNKKIATLSFLI